MRVSAKVDYAVRALVELAAAEGRGPVKGEAIAAAQDIPLKFTENILSELRRAGVVGSQRGAVGGYWLKEPAGTITVADVVRYVEGPLADVRGEPPEDVKYEGAAAPLQDVWIAARATLRSVLEVVTIADIAGGALPDVVCRLSSDPDARSRR
ncbi:MAG TPA: Rrf2 family transcriptional regulator [Acidimicrobiales bacterium]|nr:Rrf2 family transcriptional regulator [Acidimicrobiales bacterium]